MGNPNTMALTWNIVASSLGIAESFVQKTVRVVSLLNDICTAVTVISRVRTHIENACVFDEEMFFCQSTLFRPADNSVGEREASSNNTALLEISESEDGNRLYDQSGGVCVEHTANAPARR